MNNSTDSDRLTAIDQAILDLLSQRAQATTDRESPVDRNARIAELLAARESPFSRDELTSLLRHVASVCESKLDGEGVAFLGPTHSYSHLAAIKYFGESAKFIPSSNIAAVFDLVVRGEASMGIVPVENSTDGRVVDTLGMLVKNPVNICGEVLLPIHHNLLSMTKRDEVTEIYSKPQAISQCREWLAKHMPHAHAKEMSSTAAAAKLASEQHGVAAIASEAAGRQYGLNVLAASIEDNPNNITRFAVLGETETHPTGADKTALLFQVNHQPGALANVMNVFKEIELNMTWIESFPMPAAPSEYLFFVEIEAHKQDANMKLALEQLASFTQRCDILGSYPRDVSQQPR